VSTDAPTSGAPIPSPGPELEDGLAPLGGPQLLAVAELWKRSRREVVARLRGVSMEPTIPSGSEVVLRCAEPIRVGDILAFVTGDLLIVHRVIGLSDAAGWILTCGDAARVPDPPITDPRCTVGTVVMLRRGGELVTPPPPPDSLGRRLVQGVCLRVLQRWPRAGSRLVRLLVQLRRRLVNVPRIHAARHASRLGLRD
jgi:hypothetical protein